MHPAPESGSVPDAATRTATGTVLIASGLFAGKLVAAISSDSIGLVSTAVDSGLDLLISVLVLVGVTLARRPADPEHPYGHGKFENVTALFEAGVLAATGVIVGFLAVGRILEPEPFTLSSWIIVVMVAAMVFDAERALTLSREARRSRSPALRVDAWHFGSDLVTTGFVLVGIVLASRGAAWADGASALVVAVFLIAGSLHVGWSASGGLVDRVRPEVTEQVRRAIAGVDDVEDAPQVRVRGAGADLFVDATVRVPRSLGMERAHEVMDRVEEAVRAEVGDADIVVHAEPAVAGERLHATLKVLAARDPRILGIHEIYVDDLEDGRVVDCHVEVDAALSLSEAHDAVQHFEDAVKRTVLGVAGLRTHIEPMPTDPRVGREVTGSHAEVVARIEAAIAPPFTGHGGIVVKEVAGTLEAVVTVCMEPTTGLVEAHEASEELERRLLAMLPVLARVVVHVEPDA